MRSGPAFPKPQRTGLPRPGDKHGYCAEVTAVFLLLYLAVRPVTTVTVRLYLAVRSVTAVTVRCGYERRIDWWGIVWIGCLISD
ncbi:hypothetical protein [Oryza sativa Japonica Group]|uniref:Uncharacterized protein n=1 Tax=Oryza sativa subsp. japonica TaxID=39947 RepID=Q5VR77_ORYSJ|nr:hypothetical protein [Oryza sativa Japonica Group]